MNSNCRRKLRFSNMAIGTTETLGEGSGAGFSSDTQASEHDEREDKAENGTGFQSMKGLVEDDSTLLIGNGFSREAEFEQKGISIFVEVHGSMESGSGYGENCGLEGKKGSMEENGEDPGEKIVEIPGFESKIGENGDKRGDGETKHEENHNGNKEENGEEDDGGEDDGGDPGEEIPGFKSKIGEFGEKTGEKVMEILGLESKMGKSGDQTGEGEREHDENRNGNKEEEDGEEDEDGEDDGGVQEHNYSVGDFVWGKIKGHPWWPGQIYDPSNASKYAEKFNQRNRLLVAYFGDGSFSWCFPSQLKPFAEDFEEMSMQSDSKSFVNSVHKALDEIGRLVKLETTCSCIPEGSQVRLVRPSAMNAGIKQGVLVPEFDLTRLSIPQLGPAALIGNLRCIAEVGFGTNVLELTVLSSCLSAFYWSKGGGKLAIYQEPVYIEDMEDMEDMNRKRVSDIYNFVPSEEDCFFSPVKNGLGQANQPLLQKCRKRKSVAKLMKEQKVIETSNKKKRKSGEEAASPGGSGFTSPLGRKRGSTRKLAELLGSPKSTENQILSDKDGGSGGEQEETKQDRASSIENDSDAKEESDKNVFALRERKRSKYLSPPFTSFKWTVRNSSSKRALEAESIKVAKVAQVGEKMIRVADQLVRSPRIVKCNDETVEETLSKELDTTFDTSTKEVVSEIRSAALNPICLREKNSVDMIAAFVSAFRSAIFLNGSNYKMYHEGQPGRKRKSLNTITCDGDEASRLLFIKQKLEVMTSMLETADGDMLLEMKSDLEGEMRGLLEKVSSMAESTAS